MQANCTNKCTNAQTCTTTQLTNKVANVLQTKCRYHVDNHTKRKSLGLNLTKVGVT